MQKLPLRQVLPAIAGLLLVTLAVWFWQASRQTKPAPKPVETQAAITALPARPVEAPILTATESTVDPNEARARNAADPMFTGKISPASPFRFAGSDSDLARARECLSLAAMAEAGPSDTGQRAVIQVILNRVRHPAFAKTVCGVVFEGSRRATGCQFSFTCDGSLARQYSEQAWAAARKRAEGALYGQVFAGVGNATHYHTDWVYPDWSPKLVKLAQVETHLFYRWQGYWGSPAAMRIPYRGGEPRLTGLDAGTESPLPGATASFAPLPPDTPKVSSGQVKVRDLTGRGNFLLIDSHDAAEAVANARKLCGATATCRVLGWTDGAAIPTAFPIPPTSRAPLQFSYSRDPAGSEIVLYGCDWFKAASRDQCIPRAR